MLDTLDIYIYIIYIYIQCNNCLSAEVSSAAFSWRSWLGRLGVDAKDLLLMGFWTEKSPTED